MQISPPLFKVLIIPLHFHETPISVLFSLTEKKYKEKFAFMGEGEDGFQLVLQQATVEAGGTPAARVAPPCSFPGTYIQHLSIKLPEL